MDHDRNGRRRQPDQERGLRPLHPPLPEQWTSRPVRVAMSEADWERLDRLAQRETAEAPTQARAYGLAISRMMAVAPDPAPSPGPFDWLDWERRKTLRLLTSVPKPWTGPPVPDAT